MIGAALAAGLIASEAYANNQEIIRWNQLSPQEQDRELYIRQIRSTERLASAISENAKKQNIHFSIF